MDPKQVEDIFSLSPVQQGMLVQILGDPETPRYFEQMLATIRGELDLELFHRAWQGVVDRHAAFRSGIAWEGLSRPVQVVHRRVSLEMTVHDQRRLSECEQRAGLDRFLAADRERGFDLCRPPLTRLTLLRLGDRVTQLVWSSSHLVIDAWCVAIVLREVLVAYHALTRGLAPGQAPTVAPAPSYRRYVAWLKEQSFDEAERMWRCRLAGFRAPTALAEEGGGEPGGAGQDDGEQGEGWDGDHRRREIALPAAASRALHELGRRRGVTLHAVAQAAWGLLLADLSGDSDVVFGAVFSGRPPQLAGVEEIVGLFINTLPVRLSIDGERPFDDWLSEIQADQLELHRHEACPLGKVQEWSEVPRHQQLFASILVFFNVVDTSLLTAGDLSIDGVHDISRSSFPLVCRVTPAERIGLELIYDPGRFGERVIAGRLAALGGLLQAVAEAPGTTLGELLAGLARQRRSSALRRRRSLAEGRLKALRRGRVAGTAEGG